jgi:hypothetical protein
VGRLGGALASCLSHPDFYRTFEAFLLLHDRGYNHMADDKLAEIYTQHREVQNQYRYFLLAASGAAIALAINQTQAAGMSWSMAPLGIAVLCWSVSFYCGCRYLTYTEAILFSNMDLLRVQRGQHPEAGSHPEMIQAATDGIRSAIAENVITAASLARNQFRFLIAGAVFFIIWHILGMCLRSPQVAAPILH